MSPRTQATKRSYIDSTNFDHSANNMLPSPRSDDYEVIKMVPSVLSTIQPLSEVKPSNIDAKSNHTIPSGTSQKTDAEIEKPICSIKLVRRYVEEDDATSVITSEEGMYSTFTIKNHWNAKIDKFNCLNTPYRRLHLPGLSYIASARSAWLKLFRNANGIENHIRKTCMSNNYRNTEYIWSGSIHILCGQLCVQHE